MRYALVAMKNTDNIIHCMFHLIYYLDLVTHQVLYYYHDI
jgi:hypothetical protein